MYLRHAEQAYDRADLFVELGDLVDPALVESKTPQLQHLPPPISHREKTFSNVSV